MSVRRLDPVQPANFEFSPQNLTWAKKTVAQYPQGKQASAVIALLWRAQEQNNGWVSQPAMEYVARMLDMSYIRVYEVATFYTMFQLSPVGKKAHIQVCGTTPCMLRGAEELKKVCQRKIHPEPHQLSADGEFSWEEVECLGACVNAPMVQIWKDTYEDLTPESLEALLDNIANDRPVKSGPQNGRHWSMPAGGATSLTDPSLYSGDRTFTRMEPPPPPPPADAPAAAAARAAPPAPAAAQVAAVAAPLASAPAAKPAEAEVVKAAEPPKNTKSDTVSSVKSATSEAKPVAVASTGEKVTSAAPKNSVADASVGQTAVKTPVMAQNKPAASKKPVAAKKEAGKPELLTKPRGGKGDDLKLIWGVGPALEKMLNKMGIWHFDQVADWSAADLKWVDERLEGFKGRAKRDEWIKQSKKLASGWRPDNAVGDKPKGRG